MPMDTSHNGERLQREAQRCKAQVGARQRLRGARNVCVEQGALTVVIVNAGEPAVCAEVEAKTVFAAHLIEQ